MINAIAEMSWTRAVLLLLVLFAGGFVVSWATTDRRRLSRGPYIAVLAGVTGVLTAITVWLGHVPLREFFGNHWGWGILGAVVTGAVLGYGIRKTPATLHRRGRELHEAAAWEGVVYGVSEGLLLSVLPAFVAWQAAADAGWNTAATWSAAMVASAVMIAVHHLGYWDYRGTQLVEVLAGCLVLTIGYLATGSVLAPILGHVIMHIAGVTKGIELPPHRRVGGIRHA